MAERDETLDKLRQLLETDKTDVHIFNKDEVEKLLKIIQWYESLEALGRVGAGMRNTIIWIAGFATAWFAFREFVLKAIRKAAGAE